ncbi:MAG TPA: metallophosphoesterase [Hadesarchaea archaeon]|nr:metallophosphoesterase [Hadesarchaea archaeon]
MNAVPVYGSPALLVKTGRERTLVVADLHLGIESELAAKGIALPSQIPNVKTKLIELVKKHKADRLIFLGDVKHNIPIASWQEWQELPGFFEELAKFVRVDVVRGNHDGGLEGMAPKHVAIHGARGVALGKRKHIGLMHGHTWPSLELLNTKLIVIAHNHPAVEFRDELGGRIIEPVWLRVKLNRSKFQKKLGERIRNDLPELLVMPAFSKLVGGAVVNREIPEEYIGPMFKAGAVKLGEAEAYLLDGTLLGKVASLRK